MSGAGRKVFQPGEVLTASNVQNYLMDQAVQYYAGTAARGSAIGTATSEGMMSYLADSNSVQMATGTATWVNVDSLPIVAGTAERAALYPSPVQGNTVWRSDVKYMETYHTASGTAAAGWYSGQNGGLVPIIPSSITLGSGSATVASNGLITFTSSADFSINGVFSSTYERYRISVNIVTSSADTGFNSRLKLSGTASTTAYYEAGWFVRTSGGSGVTNAVVNASNWQHANSSVLTNDGRIQHCIELGNPGLAKTTNMQGQSIGQDASSIYNSNYGGIHDVKTAYDGIQFFTSNSTHLITGTVQVYGYRN